jgi:hypothetical protein
MIMSKSVFPDVLILELVAETATEEAFIREILLECSMGDGLASFSSDTRVEIKVPRNPK